MQLRIFVSRRSLEICSHEDERRVRGRRGEQNSRKRNDFCSKSSSCCGHSLRLERFSNTASILAMQGEGSKLRYSAQISLTQSMCCGGEKVIRDARRVCAVARLFVERMNIDLIHSIFATQKNNPRGCSCRDWQMECKTSSLYGPIRSLELGVSAL